MTDLIWQLGINEFARIERLPRRQALWGLWPAPRTIEIPGAHRAVHLKPGKDHHEWDPRIYRVDTLLDGVDESYPEVLLMVADAADLTIPIKALMTQDAGVFEADLAMRVELAEPLKLAWSSMRREADGRFTKTALEQLVATAVEPRVRRLVAQRTERGILDDLSAGMGMIAEEALVAGSFACEVFGLEVTQVQVVQLRSLMQDNQWVDAHERLRADREAQRDHRDAEERDRKRRMAQLEARKVAERVGEEIATREKLWLDALQRMVSIADKLQELEAKGLDSSPGMLAQLQRAMGEFAPSVDRGADGRGLVPGGEVPADSDELGPDPQLVAPEQPPCGQCGLTQLQGECFCPSCGRDLRGTC